MTKEAAQQKYFQDHLAKEKNPLYRFIQWVDSGSHFNSVHKELAELVEANLVYRAYTRMFLTETIVHSPQKIVVIPSGFSELRKLRRRGMREAEPREESFAACQDTCSTANYTVLSKGFLIAKRRELRLRCASLLRNDTLFTIMLATTETPFLRKPYPI